MANNNSPDYKKLFLQEEQRRKEEEQKRKEEEQKRKEEEQKRKEEERKRKEEEQRREEAEERTRPTTFLEFIQYCHHLLSQPLKVSTPSRSTTGTIPAPKGKHCPTRLRPWTDCISQQQAIYTRVCSYLQTAGAAPRLFTPLIALEDLARRFALRPISSEQGLETYERIAVEDHVRDIIEELCKIPAAREEFMLGDGVWFDNHVNALTETYDDVDSGDLPKTRRPRPDQFCIHRVDGDSNSLLLTVEYKPPHKLSVENLRVGLRPMELWEELVSRNTIPTDPSEKLQYNAELLSNSALVQTYDVMIEEGRAYAILTNGLARVLLYVAEEDPATLYYHLCEPNREDLGLEQSWQQPQTSIARVLCLCLMSFRSPTRNHKWRNSARSQVKNWETSFDRARSSIPESERGQSPLLSKKQSSTLPPSSSDYQPSSSPLESPTGPSQMRTRSQASCAPLNGQRRTPSPGSSGSEQEHATRPKRSFSAVSPSSSPSAQRAARHQETSHPRDGQSRGGETRFCTQRCLLGLRAKDFLDEACPNVGLHRQGQADCANHRITADDLVLLLQSQLDEDIDRCMPIGECGAYGAPFKLTCVEYGYTVIGKGTTSDLWQKVSHEAQVYKILRPAQGSAVPVFLGTIDMAKIYSLHGAGPICHMLVMGWGGECTASMEPTSWLRREIRISIKEIERLGISHEDLRWKNILWSEELKRALIIDFHHSVLNYRPALQQARTAKRPIFREKMGRAKRPRVV